MIVYQSTKGAFLDDILSNEIERIIQEKFLKTVGHSVQASELRSWKESLRYMGAVLNDHEIPSDAGVAIEYHIPQTSKRIDFILTGEDDTQREFAILIELKQWSSAQITEKDGTVITRFEKGEAETPHPSYQVWSYAALLNGFNATVEEEHIQLQPCAYLHNYVPDGVIANAFYREYIERAPLFLKGAEEQAKLRSFIKQFVKHGDKRNTLFRIENGKIRPSKSLADSLAKMLKGNQEFIMVDDQKVVFETAMALARKSSKDQKHVLIVEGGPGTGKTVVAVNLLVSLTKQGLLSQYVTKNAAPRAVYASKLKGTLKMTEIDNLFTGSGSFTSTALSMFDALIVDEAHRLNEKSGMYQNMGENQIKELIHSAKFTLFFIDEDQRVTFADIGEKSSIHRWAQSMGAIVHEMELASQFRCNGSDGYLAWLDDTLGIRETANATLDPADYDFRVLSSPNELRDLIVEKNKLNNKARLVAGYCWDWVSKKDRNQYDIVIPQYDFHMRWNLASDGSLWIIAPESVNEVGCIHTCQGLEVDYIGVIIGGDLRVENDKIVCVPSCRARTDKSLFGYQKMRRENPAEAEEKAASIIKNTYRALMTRGMKGCYVYCVDKELEAALRLRLS